MNVKFLPTIRLYTHKDYRDKFNNEKIKVKFYTKINIDGWELLGVLPDLSDKLDKEIWLP